jgi:hypothetical protein
MPSHPPPKTAAFSSLLLLATLCPRARAQEKAADEPAQPARAAATPTGAAEVVPAKATQRSVSLEPKLAEPGVGDRPRFHVDPIADTALIGLSIGFATVLELINSTGEIRPTPIAADFDRNNLIGIDRASITATPDSKAGSYSNLGLGAAVAFAFIDPVLSGFREKSVQTGLVDAMLYAESVSMTFAFTDMVKLAVRRPRPGAYRDAEAHKGEVGYTNPSTDSALSFFSGHASITAAVGATATYLAFTRSAHSARPWITLVAATALTSFVSIERVQAGKHFPTDVLAGAVAGAGFGVIVPHLHRVEEVEQRRVWIGFAPAGGEVWGGKGGTLHLSGTF